MTALEENTLREDLVEDSLEMNKKEREKLKVLIRLECKTLTQKIASQQLKLSVRQVQRLLKRYRNKGESALISLQKGKKSNNRLSNISRQEIAKIIIDNYHDFGPTFAYEKLTEVHKIKISISSVRNIMIENAIWNSRRPKKENIHQRREPRACVGELLQMDGSYHDWFEGRAEKCCLIVLIDDATSRIMWLQFVKWESCFGYFNAIKAYLKKHGIPLSIYTDRLAVFETTRKTEKNYKDTQFHRAVSSLGINLILANSPQAKGRVERANETLQDRLVKEMRLAHICSMAEGNTFLIKYMEMHNKKFAKQPKSSIDAHKALDIDLNLEKILCLHHERQITKDLMINFKGKTYQITEPSHRHRLSGKKVLVLEREANELEFIYKNKRLSFKVYQDLAKENRPRKTKIEPVIDLISPRKRSRGGHPGRYHPWRTWKQKDVSI